VHVENQKGNILLAMRP